MSGGSDVDSRIQQIVNNPPIVQNGNDITIGERHNNDLYRNISIDYDITLPKPPQSTPPPAPATSQIQDVGATLKAQSGSGSVRAHGIQGPATLGTGSGDIELQQTGPGDVKAETGSGSIRLQGLSGALKASTGSGDIEAQGNPPQTGSSTPAAAPSASSSATPTSTSTPTPAPAASTSRSPSPCRAASTATTSVASSTAAAPPSGSVPAPATFKSNSSMDTSRRPGAAALLNPPVPPGQSQS